MYRVNNARLGTQTVVLFFQAVKPAMRGLLVNGTAMFSQDSMTQCPSDRELISGPQKLFLAVMVFMDDCGNHGALVPHPG
jgi:hypothetical protein